MEFEVIIAGLVVFILSMAIHVVAWRLVRPKSYFMGLPMVFGALPCLGLVLYAMTGALFTPLGTTDLTGWLGAILLHLALSGAYIMTYPALQASSPSLVIVLKVQEAMPRGLTAEELSGLFADRGLIGERIEDLAGSGLIDLSGTTCTITPRGRFLLKPFALLRRLLGLEAGKG